MIPRTQSWIFGSFLHGTKDSGVSFFFFSFFLERRSSSSPSSQHKFFKRFRKKKKTKIITVNHSTKKKCLIFESIKKKKQNGRKKVYEASALRRDINQPRWKQLFSTNAWELLEFSFLTFFFARNFSYKVLSELSKWLTHYVVT